MNEVQSWKPIFKHARYIVNTIFSPCLSRQRFHLRLLKSQSRAFVAALWQSYQVFWSVSRVGKPQIVQNEQTRALSPPMFCRQKTNRDRLAHVCNSTGIEGLVGWWEHDRHWDWEDWQQMDSVDTCSFHIAQLMFSLRKNSLILAAVQKVGYFDT